MYCEPLLKKSRTIDSGTGDDYGIPEGIYNH